MNEALSKLPRVDHVLVHPLLDDARAQAGPLVKSLVRTVLAEARAAVMAGDSPIDAAEVALRVARRARAWSNRRTQAVINATGVILHTNLGRAPLSASAVEALASAAAYTNLELELEKGTRGGRAAFVESALATLTGAESALIVNNNAGAVLLALAAVALGKGVVVSRGELVEIGGGFRVPDVLGRSGARLVEVGTTNRTHVSDYERALDTTPDAAAILRVHPGNFRQIGFVERPSLLALVDLGRRRGVRVVEDLGGGALVDLEACGLGADPLVSASVATGADVVTFSTDKILGGPQGGALVGKRDVIERARRDPLARALRLGRLPLVALEATLSSYLAGDFEAIPALRMARRSGVELHARAVRWAEAIDDPRATIVATRSVAGGGTYAGDELDSWALAIAADDPDALVASLRSGQPAVVARIHDGSVVLDARTVLDDEDDALVAAVRRVLQRGP